MFHCFNLICSKMKWCPENRVCRQFINTQYESQATPTQAPTAEHTKHIPWVHYLGNGFHHRLREGPTVSYTGHAAIAHHLEPGGSTEE